MGVLWEEMVLIGSREKGGENYFGVIKVLDWKGNEVDLIRNGFDLSGEEIWEM